MKSQLFFFNPTCEMAIANGQVSYMPPRHLARFEADLAALPFLFGDETDYILTPGLANDGSLDHLRRMGWRVPTLIPGSEQLSALHRGPVQLRPWGWSPAVYRVFRPFMSVVDPEWLSGPFSVWRVHLANLLSRGTGYRLLKGLQTIFSENQTSYSLLAVPDLPLVIEKAEDLESVLETLPLPSVLKTQWSASGRGLYRIRDQRDDPARSEWVRGMLKRQGVLYGEPWLDKVQDVSFHFWLEKDRIEYLGYNFFQAEASGQFRGCAVGWPENNTPLWQDLSIVQEALEQAAALLLEGLSVMQLNRSYTGPVGVDALFFRSGKGELRLNPCLEVNMRYSMGLANVFLRNRVNEEGDGLWKIDSFKAGEWKAFCKEKMCQYPTVVEDGILQQGFCPLVSPLEEKEFGAWLLMRR